MTKRRLDGSTFMVMYSGIQSTSHCLQQRLVPAPSYLLCKYAFGVHLLKFCTIRLFYLFIYITFDVKQSGNFVYVHMFSERFSFSCLH